MTKVNTTISLDQEIKKKSLKVLKEKGFTLTLFVEQALRKLLNDERSKREVE